MARFKPCLNSSTIRPTPLVGKIQCAAAAGYEGIEIWHDDVDAYLQQGGSLADVRKQLDDLGLAVPTTIYLADWFDASADNWQAALDECRRRMDQSVVLGAPFVIAGPPGGTADYQLGAENYQRLLETGVAMGVKPSMEFLGFVEQLNTIEDALEIIQQCGHEAATTVLDPFHIFRGGGSIESIAKLTASQIAISHFNDAPAEPARETQHDPDRVMPGDGHLDLHRYCQLLAETGYDSWLSLELFREDLWQQDPLEVAKTGLAKMQPYLEG